ncbi:hypothetical protein BDV34DRAFT_201258 [Aspergillus parasiticus]|uniref:Transmembrane protein n=1 Tax=Aspergillus parasiticus TaxID=5067 RepID=A0A5N6DAM0_ASPPA|nr:hypothetical protein BDV34DRAFT_201258 [Aspergillus parasiticus]
MEAWELTPPPPNKRKERREKEEDLNVVEHRVRCRFSFVSPSLFCGFFSLLFSSFHPFVGYLYCSHVIFDG